MDRPLKDIEFRGSSLEDLSRFPGAARRRAGYELFKVQEGTNPEDWKPMSDVGPGAREIRIRDASGIFRVMYVAKFEDCVYVLHCFQKKTRKTAPGDLALAKRRYKELVRELSR